MKILVSGASGLVGSALVPSLRASGHEVVRFVRRTPAAPDERCWEMASDTLDPAHFTDAGAVIHLAGESIAAGRWTPARKARIRSSRVDTTRELCRVLAGLKAKPATLLVASAIGYYGNRGDTVVTVEDTPGSDFLAGLCVDWENAAETARSAGIRVVHLRFGIILSRRGGALAKMLLPFRLGLGGPVGDGRQWMSWVSLDDVLGVIGHVLATPALAGAVNVVAPNPVRSRDFARALGRTLRRPAVLPLPAFAARLMLGEMADPLLLASIRVQPSRLVASGYRFRFPELDRALARALAD